MKHFPIAIFGLGTLMLVIHLFEKFVTGFGGIEASDVTAILVLAGVAHMLLGKPKHENEVSKN